MDELHFLSVDTFSFTIKNMTIKRVFNEILHLDVSGAADDNIMLSTMMAVGNRTFTLHGVQIGMPQYELGQFVGSNDDIRFLTDGSHNMHFGDIEHIPGFMDVPFSSIRVYISGTGMQYCRANSDFPSDFHAFDNYLLYLPALYFKSHGLSVTRCDFAVDVYNENTSTIENRDFIDMVSPYIDECNEIHTRYKFGRRGRSIKCRRVAGSARVLYFGSTNSDTLLRVYDKFLECADEDRILPTDRKYPGGVDPFDIQSWVRFELQLRARDVLPFLPVDTNSPSLFTYDHSENENLDAYRLLNYIRDKFVLTTTTDQTCDESISRQIHPLPCWVSYFEHFTQSPILYVGNFVQFREPLEKSINFSNGSALVPNLVTAVLDPYVSTMGVQALSKRQLCDLYRIIFPNPLSERDQKQRLAFFGKFRSCGYSFFDAHIVHKPSVLSGRVQFYYDMLNKNLVTDFDPSDRSIYLLDLSTGERRLLVKASEYPSYLESLYISGIEFPDEFPFENE